MKQSPSLEKYSLIAHLASMAFGLAGLLLVVPNPDILASLPDFGKVVFRWSMAGGGVVYMVLGTIAMALYGKRALGTWHWLTFMIPAVSISLTSELLGTSTGFPFGHYRYLSGLGYKIAGLVPFTIPLSWFYLGFSAFLLATAAVKYWAVSPWIQKGVAIAIGSLLLMSWDFVLDPAMSQTNIPFWTWEQEGAFFGMPYENFLGWFGTGAVFMTVATLLWQRQPRELATAELTYPFVMYLGNFGFALVMSLGSGLYGPVPYGLVLGLVPALVCYWVAKKNGDRPALNIEMAQETEKIPVA